MKPGEFLRGPLDVCWLHAHLRVRRDIDVANRLAAAKADA